MHLARRDLGRQRRSPAPVRAPDRRAVGGLAGKRLALLGLAFKADTDDVRSSPAVRLASRLLDEGADLRAHDPAAGPNARRVRPDLVVVPSVEEALRDADAAVIATEWPIYRDLDWAALRPTMKTPLIIDGRRLLPEAALRGLGYTVVRVGDGVGEDATDADSAPTLATADTA